MQVNKSPQSRRLATMLHRDTSTKQFAVLRGQYSHAIAEQMSAMTPDLFAEMRHAMVISQLRPDGVTDMRVIDAMKQIPREDYVPDDRRTTAYADRVIPLPGGRGMNSPTVIGRLLSEARIMAGERVLIVASATGYTSAVATLLTQTVTSAETVAEIDGVFDVILIDGAVAQVPSQLVDHLDANGRLVTGIVDSGVTRLAIGRKGGSSFGLHSFMDAEMVILPEFALPAAFVF